MCDITEIVTIFIVFKKIKSIICELLMILNPIAHRMAKFGHFDGQIWPFCVQ